MPGDGDYRDNQMRSKNYPNTALVTSSDLGAGVHPVNKSGYGDRASRVGLGFVYGKPVEGCGSGYKSPGLAGS